MRFRPGTWHSTVRRVTMRPLRPVNAARWRALYYAGCTQTTVKTSGYATMVHGRGCNPHRSTTTFANLEITSLWRHNSETIRDREKRREKRRPPRPMKSSELANGENRIAVRQLLQNRKWRHNLGSRWKLQKMAPENFSIGAFYNITKNQDNMIKTVGQDSFLSPKTPKNTSF